MAIAVTKIRYLCAGVMLCTTLSLHAELPVNVRADALASDIVDAIKHNQSGQAMKYISAYRALESEGHKTPAPILFMEARLADSAGDKLRAYDAVEAYLSITEKSDRNYAEGLRLYNRLSKDPALKDDPLVGRMVTIDYAFKIGKYEVTQGQWQAVMGGNPSHFSSCGSNCPVESVSWDDVQVFLTKLNQKTGQHYRLPTEKEWERACGTGSEYCGGDTPDAVAWYEGNSGSKTHPVGQKQANANRLYDLSGNVWELTSDCWESGCSRRVLRGGSWNYNAAYLRAAFRDGYTPGARNSLLGFRLAQDL